MSIWYQNHKSAMSGRVTPATARQGAKGLVQGAGHGKVRPGHSFVYICVNGLSVDVRLPELTLVEEKAEDYYSRDVVVVDLVDVKFHRLCIKHRRAVIYKHRKQKSI